MDDKELKAYLQREDIIIEHNRARWEISMSGEVQGFYTGAFVFKCFLTPSEKLAAGRDYRDMLGNNAVLALEHEESLAFTISQLKYRVLEAPPFWTSAVGMNGIRGDLPDENVLNSILDAAMSAEFKYLALLRDKKEKALSKAKRSAENIAETRDKDLRADLEKKE